MKLVEFSVTNYRSITFAHKIKLQNLTVLVGKNNEGKSNILNALNVAMTAIIMHGHFDSAIPPRQRRQYGYLWQRDFPLQFQSRKSGLESIFRLHFRLEGEELTAFHNQTGIRGNEDIPIAVKVGKDNLPRVEVPKRGSSSYNRKSREITDFIAKRITFNPITAIRTENMAITAVQDAIWSELRTIKTDPEYIAAEQKIIELQQAVLDRLSDQLIEPLRAFLPNLSNIIIKREFDDFSYRQARNDIDMILDDGNATSIRYKGDGIKSLVTLAILKDRRNFEGASVVAIEEPESHLHSGAIHNLVDIIHKMAENSQVIITTHNPLFVQQNNVAANIIVNEGTARPAKSIAEIRNILGVLPSDNLRNARHVLLVEGEDDKISLEKLLPAYSEVIKQAIRSNQLVIKSMSGASNLMHDAADLKHSMCKFVVLLDHDRAGKESADRAIENGVLRESEVKYTICNGSPESEFEDCIKPNIYKNRIMDEFSVDLSASSFRGRGKWSERMKNTFLDQGTRWDDTTEKKVKLIVAESLPAEISPGTLRSVLIEQKAGFLAGLTTAIENMLADS